jgi:hypothetical protein
VIKTACPLFSHSAKISASWWRLLKLAAVGVPLLFVDRAVAMGK